MRRLTVCRLLVLCGVLTSTWANAACVDPAQLARSTASITRHFDEKERDAHPGVTGIQGTGWFLSPTMIVTAEHVTAAIPGRDATERARVHASHSREQAARGPPRHYNSSKKSFPLSSTTINAGKSTTSIFRIASIPSSSKSTISTFLMFDCARMAAGPPMLPK
jgi:hypothetical protein